MKKIRLGIIGCGRIVQNCHIPAIANNDNIELVAVCDVNSSLAQTFALEHHIGRVYAGGEELCSAKDVDAVLICLPHHLHKQAVVAAAKAGKHLLVEKPLANTMRECDEIISEVEKAGVTLMVGHVMRFSSDFQKIRNAVKSGDIGKPISIRARRLTYHEKAATDWWKSRNMCGGLVTSLVGSHIFDSILWIFDAIPKKVFALGRTLRPHLWEGEDEADILIELSNNTTALISLSFNCKLTTNDILIVGDRDSLYTKDEDLVVEQQKNSINEKFGLQIKEFVSAVLENRPPLVDGKQAQRVVAIIEAVNKSISTGKVIEL